MSKAAKIWLITAAFLVLIGSGVFTGVMAALKWDFTQLSTVQYETNVHLIGNDYTNIAVIADTADIVLVPCGDENATVTCYESQSMKHSVSVKNGTLVIEVIDTRQWYDYINIGFNKPTITVSIPSGIYGSLSVESKTSDVDIPNNFSFRHMNIAVSTGDVRNRARTLEFMNIKTTTGDIDVADITASSLDLSATTGNITVARVTCVNGITLDVSTGKTHLRDVVCKSLTSNGSTGDIRLKNAIVSGALYIKRSTGDVTFDGCDAANMTVQTDTGDVTGHLLSEKVFITQSDTGRIEVPKAITGGKCDISTDTGDIVITVG